MLRQLVCAYVVRARVFELSQLLVKRLAVTLHAEHLSRTGGVAVGTNAVVARSTSGVTLDKRDLLFFLRGFRILNGSLKKIEILPQPASFLQNRGICHVNGMGARCVAVLGGKRHFAVAAVARS